MSARPSAAALACGLFAAAFVSCTPAPAAPASAQPPPMTPPTVAPAPAAAPGPGDAIAEPKAPESECHWRPFVRCVPGAAAADVGLPPPYQACVRELPATPQNRSTDVNVARFSANSTRAARGADPRSCCYIEFVQGACD